MFGIGVDITIFFFAGKRKRPSNKKGSSRSRTPLSTLDENTSSPVISLDSQNLDSPALSSMASSTGSRPGSRSNRSGSLSNPRSSKLSVVTAGLHKNNRNLDSPAFDFRPGLELEDGDDLDYVDPPRKFTKATDFMCGLDESSGSSSEGEGGSGQLQQPPSRRRKIERPRAVVTDEMLQGLIEEPKQTDRQSDISSDELPDLLS